MNPYGAEDAQLLSMMKDLGIGAGVPSAQPAQRFFRSETGEITIDGPRDVLVLDTPRTAGGYAPAGQDIETTKGGVRIRVEGSDATAWVSALDDQPIRQSRRLLVTHLTDLQNTGIRYAEAARRFSKIGAACRIWSGREKPSLRSDWKGLANTECGPWRRAESVWRKFRQVAGTRLSSPPTLAADPPAGAA